jgi:hypothetical protein
MDQIVLFKQTGMVVNDFQTDDVSGWFDYGDWGSGAALVRSVGLTNTLSTIGAVSNTVMLVDYVSAGWGVGVGQDVFHSRIGAATTALASGSSAKTPARSSNYPHRQWR